MDIRKETKCVRYAYLLFFAKREDCFIFVKKLYFITIESSFYY